MRRDRPRSGMSCALVVRARIQAPGSVRRLLYGTRLEVPDALLIRAGLFRRRWLVVAIEAVSEAIPWQGTLKLALDGIRPNSTKT